MWAVPGWQGYSPELCCSLAIVPSAIYPGLRSSHNLGDLPLGQPGIPNPEVLCVTLSQSL